MQLRIYMKRFWGTNSSKSYILESCQFSNKERCVKSNHLDCFCILRPWLLSAKFLDAVSSAKSFCGVKTVRRGSCRCPSEPFPRAWMFSRIRCNWSYNLTERNVYNSGGKIVVRLTIFIVAPTLSYNYTCDK